MDTGRPPLTAREKEVVHFLAKGLSSKAIASALDIGYETVLSHLRHIFLKLEVHDRTEAVVRAQRLGILPLD